MSESVKKTCRERKVNPITGYYIPPVRAKNNYENTHSIIKKTNCFKNFQV